MSGHVVVDTSVVIKWFRQGEVLADQALAVRAAYVDGRLRVSVPALLAYELANVLRYKADLTTTQVGEAVQSLFDMGCVGYLRHPPLTMEFGTRTRRRFVSL